MVREGIVLGHKISYKGIEVDQAKVELITKLPPQVNEKGIRSFLVFNLRPLQIFAYVQYDLNYE